jgi:hypothetical protein
VTGEKCASVPEGSKFGDVDWVLVVKEKTSKGPEVASGALGRSDWVMRADFKTTTAVAGPSGGANLVATTFTATTDSVVVVAGFDG